MESEEKEKVMSRRQKGEKEISALSCNSIFFYENKNHNSMQPSKENIFEICALK